MTNSWREEVTPEDIKEFLLVHGKVKGVKTFAVLERSSKFYDAITSELGQELLKDVMVKMELLLNKIIKRKATEEETIKYDIYSDIFNEWAVKIGRYIDLRNKVKGKV